MSKSGTREFQKIFPSKEVQMFTMMLIAEVDEWWLKSYMVIVKPTVVIEIIWAYNIAILLFIGMLTYDRVMRFVVRWPAHNSGVHVNG